MTTWVQPLSASQAASSSRPAVVVAKVRTSRATLPSAARRTLQLPTSSTSRRGGYRYGFDLRLNPIRLDHVGAVKRLCMEEYDLEDRQQTINSVEEDVGNYKRTDRWRRAPRRSGPSQGCSVL